MSCNNFRSRVREYIDGELHNDLKEFMDKHLERCPECRELYNKEKELDNIFINALISTEIEYEDFKNSVMKNIDKSKYIKKRGTYKSFFMAASILILVLVGIDIGKDSTNIIVNNQVLENRLESRGGALYISSNLNKDISCYVDLLKYNSLIDGIKSDSGNYIANIQENNIYVQDANNLTTKKYSLEGGHEIEYIRWIYEDAIEVSIPVLGIYEINIQTDSLNIKDIK